MCSKLAILKSVRFRSACLPREERSSALSTPPTTCQSPIFVLCPLHWWSVERERPLFGNARPARPPHSPSSLTRLRSPPQTPPRSTLSRGPTVAPTSGAERRFASRRVAFPRDHRYRKSGRNDAVFVVFLSGWRSSREATPRGLQNRYTRVRIPSSPPRNRADSSFCRLSVDRASRQLLPS